VSNNRKLALVNRRYLRIKVFQGLYAFHRTPSADLIKHERDIFESINRLYDLYLNFIALMMQVNAATNEMIEQGLKKNLPTEADLNPNRRFVNNRVFRQFKSSETLKLLLAKKKISWVEDNDDIRRIIKAYREDEVFQLYMIREDNNMQLDKEIMIYIFKEYLGLNEIVHNTLEEQDIYWQDDMPMAALALIKTIETMPEEETSHRSFIADLYKSKDEDQLFVKDLFRKSIQLETEYTELISSKAQNWETERIAMLDMLLMRMALVELEHFPTVPVKVTLNEYIELAKSYSTPKSKVFINGVLDKLVAEFKRDDRIKKRGRGLVE
jgi:N utilization substance protein B